LNENVKQKIEQAKKKYAESLNKALLPGGEPVFTPEAYPIKRWGKVYEQYLKNPIPFLERSIRKREELIAKYKRLIEKHKKAIKRLKKLIRTYQKREVAKNEESNHLRNG